MVTILYFMGLVLLFSEIKLKLNFLNILGEYLFFLGEKSGKIFEFYGNVFVIILCNIWLGVVMLNVMSCRFPDKKGKWIERALLLKQNESFITFIYSEIIYLKLCSATKNLHLLLYTFHSALVRVNIILIYNKLKDTYTYTSFKKMQ